MFNVTDSKTISWLWYVIIISHYVMKKMLYKMPDTALFTTSLEALKFQHSGQLVTCSLQKTKNFFNSTVYSFFRKSSMRIEDYFRPGFAFSTLTDP